MSQIDNLIKIECEEELKKKKIPRGYKLDPDVVKAIQDKQKERKKALKMPVTETAVVSAAIRIGLGLQKKPLTP